MDISLLKKDLTNYVIKNRLNNNKEIDHSPKYAKVGDFIHPDGHVSKRLKVILKTKGCSVPTCTVCFIANDNNKNIKEKMIIDQLKELLKNKNSFDNFDTISLYNNGSFFSPSELSEQTRIEIAKIISKFGISTLTVDSLPQFITKERLTSFINALGDVKLIVGIGLQSANPIVREFAVNTTCTNKAYEKTISLLQELNVLVKTYILLKPPFLTESEAVIDALESIIYCKNLGVKYITLCPVSIYPNTLVWDLMKIGKYKPLNFWTIVETIIKSPKDTIVRVVGYNLREEYTIPKFPTSCDKCISNVKKSIGLYNIGKFDLKDLTYCSCAPTIDYSKYIDNNIILERIEHALKSLKQFRK